MNASQMFQYEPKCIAPGCDQLAVFKIGATWTSGAFSELKNYGTCCTIHRASMVQRAREVCQKVTLAEGESLGPVTVYKLVPGARDKTLPVADDNT